MTDLAHDYGGDLSWGATGDLAVATVPAVTQQRVLRRLLTNAGDYIWQLGYGGGLPAMVGTPANAAAIEAIIRSQLFQEAAIQQAPAPTVKVSASPNGVVLATVRYTDADTGQTQTLTVPVP